MSPAPPPADTPESLSETDFLFAAERFVIFILGENGAGVHAVPRTPGKSISPRLVEDGGTRGYRAWCDYVGSSMLLEDASTLVGGSRSWCDTCRSETVAIMKTGH